MSFPENQEMVNKEGESVMNKYLVMILKDIALELGVEDALKAKKQQLIELIQEMLELDTEYRDTMSKVEVVRNFKLSYLAENDFIFFIGNQFKYKDFLISLLALLMFT